MPKKFYTIWKGNENGEDEPILLKGEKFYFFKWSAFRRAKQLAKELPLNWDLAILVRRVTVGSDECVEYVFPAIKKRARNKRN